MMVNTNVINLSASCHFKKEIWWFQASDVGSSMFVHVFGAYFGLAVNFIVQRRCIRQQFKEDDRTLSSRSIVSVTVGISNIVLMRKIIQLKRFFQIKKGR